MRGSISSSTMSILKALILSSSLMSSLAKPRKCVSLISLMEELYDGHYHAASGTVRRVPGLAHHCRRAGIPQVATGRHGGRLVSLDRGPFLWKYANRGSTQPKHGGHPREHGSHGHQCIP